MIQGGPDDLSNEMQTLPNQDIHRFNIQLDQTMSHIIDAIDQSQTQAVNDISLRQTDLFALTNKHRVPTAFKNDAIGVFYDAKSNITQTVTRLKMLVQEKQNSIIKQLIKPSAPWLEQNDLSQQYSK